MNLKPRHLSTSGFCIGLGLKLLMGLAYGYLFLHFYNGDDTWKIHRLALKETSLLLADPGQFFLNEYTPVEASRNGHTFLEIFILYLNDLEYALVVKTIALFNLISQGNYYINALLFNLITFWGHYWLYIFLTNIFPGARKKLFAAIFLFLPAIFWLSGIRSDGLLFFFFSLFLLQLQRKNIMWMLAGFAGMFIMRPQFAILFAVALVPYFISLKCKYSTLKVFTVSYLAAIILFFALGLQEAVAGKQQQFLQLNGTRFEMKKLEPTIKSFTEMFPVAFNHTFLRPYPWETKNLLQLFYSFEMIFCWLLLIFMVFNVHPGWKQRLYHPVILMLLFFSISLYILTGYIVPFPGAITRYKIIAELLLVCVATILIKENFNIDVFSKKQEFKQ